MQQFFIEEKNGDIVHFSSEQQHQIINVLRYKEGKLVKVVINQRAFLVRLCYNGNELFGQVEQELGNIAKNVVINLFPALIKKDKWDFLLMKASEFNADHIYPLNTTNCVVKISDEDSKKIERFNKICLEACEQCKRNDLVQVHSPISLKQIKDYPADLMIVAYEKENSTHFINNLNDDFTTINIVIGPEGGFTSKEIDYLTSIGYLSVTLGNNIFRAESAAIYCLNCLDAYFKMKG
ncbi:MAG: RsmE family RNA methyltransferase [Erysipelotrichaceae bacterium]